LLVRSDPKPDDCVGLLDQTYGLVIAPDANGDYRLGSVNSFEMETRMTRVADEQTIRDARLFTYITWKGSELLPKRRRGT
jgi:hypothetical protein